MAASETLNSYINGREAAGMWTIQEVEQYGLYA